MRDEIKPIREDPMYNELKVSQREVIDALEKFALHIIEGSDVVPLGQKLDIGYDAENEWCNYIFYLRCASDKTLEMNCLFNDTLIRDEYSKDINENIVFRFESGYNEMRT